MRVTFEDVGVRIGERCLFRGVNLEVPSGSVLGLLGPNGCGKSTLLRTLYRRHKPTSGAVRLDGIDVRALAGRELARRVAVMAQETSHDFPVTVHGMVMLGRVPYQRGFGADSDVDRGLVDTALREVGALKLAGRQFAGLSGGEKQRVLLARTLAQQTPVLILDEPTNHLDISFQLELMALATGRGLTVLAALHDMNIAAEFCDHLALLQGGGIAAVGPPGDVLGEDTIQAAFGVRARTLAHPLTQRPLIALARPAPDAAAMAHQPARPNEP
ncbi:ABC transporter ATP-binding protein [Arthrobacter sp. HY1533]|uniref:ABC transporter ATP-binding protein n=1 Tax=Arthrobacter sp. HY1533 TaxID=2970919 RepID=UPI0022B9E2B3|nr:ABC transporter ATP-binding protein [Arthrobacter sp. HY1533]